MTWKLFLFIHTAWAQVGTTPPGGGISLPNPLGSCDLNCVAGRIIDFLGTIAIPLIAIMVVIGGFQIMTAGGNPENLQKGRKTLIYAAIGFAVVLAASSVAVLVKLLLTP